MGLMDSSYHTSDRVIESPELRAGRKNADFGQGFYLSPDSGFAGAWESAHILTADEIKAARDLYDIQSREFEIAFAAAVSRIDV